MIKKEIAEKLFKAELAQERVELGLMQEVDRLNKEQEKIEGSWAPSMNKAEAQLKTLRRSLQDWLENRKEWEKWYTKVQEYEKELGVKTGIREPKADQTVAQVKKMQDTIDKFISQMNSI